MATVTGLFPVLSEPCILVRNATFYQKRGTAIERTTYPSGATEFPYASEINSLFNHTDYSAAQPNMWFGPRNVKIVGEPSQVPPSRLLSGPIIKVDNSPFLKRMKRGEMVVSDYQRLSAFLVYANGGEKIPGESRVVSFNTGPLRGPFQRPTFLAAGTNISSWSLRPETEALNASLYTKRYVQQTFEDTKSPYAVGWSDHYIQDWLDHFKFPDEIHQLVTENTSEANTATVDILTTLAELPETVLSVFKGMVTLKKLFVDAKNQKWSMLNKAKRVRYELQRAQRRVEFELRSQWLEARNNRARAKIDLQIKRSRAQLKRDLDRSWRDFLTGVASVELTVRYGILPVKYTIDGLVDILLSMQTEYVRWASRLNLNVDPPYVPGFKTSGTVSVELRAFIKRQFDAVSGFAEKLKYFSGSIVVTAYELIPLSFVLDWFVQVGDLLKSFFGSNLSNYKQAATISLKVSGQSLSYIHEATGCTVTVDIKGYMRKVINPSDYCRLSSTPDVTGYRIYDALALSWQLIVKKLIPQLKQDVKIT